MGGYWRFQSQKEEDKNISNLKMKNTLVRWATPSIRSWKWTVSQTLIIDHKWLLIIVLWLKLYRPIYITPVVPLTWSYKGFLITLILSGRLGKELWGGWWKNILKQFWGTNFWGGDNNFDSFLKLANFNLWRGGTKYLIQYYPWSKHPDTWFQAVVHHIFAANAKFLALCAIS